MIFSLTSCNEKGLTFDPHFFVPSVKHQALIDKAGAKIPFDSVAVQQYGCMHKNKIAELAILLQNAKPLKSNNSEVTSVVRGLINQIDEQE